MKKLLLFILISVSALKISAQTKSVSVANVATFQIPSSAKTVSRAELYSSEKQRQYSALAKDKHRDNIFEIGTMLLKFYPGEGDFDKDYMYTRKMDFDQYYYKKLTSYFKSSIQDAKDGQVLRVQMEFSETNRGSYQILKLNSAKNKLINFVIEYDVSERQKATELGESILSGSKVIQ